MIVPKDMWIAGESFVSYLLWNETLLTMFPLLVWRSHFGGTELISLELSVGTVPISSRCALFSAQQSFSWLLCERWLVWVAMTGRPVVGHQLRGDWWFPGAEWNSSSSSLSLAMAQGAGIYSRQQTQKEMHTKAWTCQFISTHINLIAFKGVTH